MRHLGLEIHRLEKMMARRRGYSAAHQDADRLTECTATDPVSVREPGSGCVSAGYRKGVFHQPFYGDGDVAADGEKRAVELQNFYADLQKAVWLYTSENALESDTARINSFEIYCSYTH